MQRYTILWADDEIELLRAHILFLSQKGYDVTPVNSGIEALEMFNNHSYDLVFLDENMPGMNGLEVLGKIKNIRPNTPVVMITKSEEEHLMEQAIGSKIADYLIKPLNPNQILLSIKKILDNKRLVTEKTNLSYQQDFRNLSVAFGDVETAQEWIDVYKKLIYWELEIDQTEYKSMKDVIEMQKSEANNNFADFIIDNYEDWINKPDEDTPLLSHQLMSKKVFPHINETRPIVMIIIDNLRYDQWKILEPQITEYFKIDEEDAYYSILPTTTAYSRNAIFSGLMPQDMQSKHPKLWVEDIDDEGKNLHEAEFLQEQLASKKIPIKVNYHKIVHGDKGKQLADNYKNLLQFSLSTIVFNFVDMLSHARTDMNVIKELASDESAYRSLTKSWFEHSSLFDLLKKLSSHDVKVIITTDHGTVRVKKAHRIIGDKNTNTNLRYKLGKNLNFDEKNVFVIRKPESIKLPKPNVSTTYVFATEDTFFAYPNNYNQYVNMYENTFQHGGISLEEIIIPVITLSSKKR